MTTDLVVKLGIFLKIIESRRHAGLRLSRRSVDDKLFHGAWGTSVGQRTERMMDYQSCMDQSREANSNVKQ
jgi:hypothetical protein